MSAQLKMSSQTRMDIRSFYKTVHRKEVHLANMVIENYRDHDKAVVEAEKKRQLQLEIASRNAARNNEARMRRLNAKQSLVAGDKRSEEEKIQDEIDAVAEEIPEVNTAAKESRKRQSRPENWEDIAYEAEVYGNTAALKNYTNEFIGASSTAIYQRLNQWKNDVKNKRIMSNTVITRLPSYGSEIDSQLLTDVHELRSMGLPVDDDVLRRYLVVRLENAGKMGLLVENGGKYSYGHSWAMRFFKRHNLVVRVCTTKMRELPQDFEDKKAKYMKIGAELIYQHNVPPQLVINGDETAVQLVNRAKITRNEVGAKRVRVLGIGDDKAQITATIFVTEHGDVLPYQMIFTGTTGRCHPSGAVPDDCIWTHTSSHWQSVQSYMEVIEKIIIPYKTNMIQKLRLPSHQATILKHDLHFTHKDNDVLELLKKNHIHPLFVPAGCTDAMQECDVVVNKPFKNAVRKAFRDHLDNLFQVHRAKNLPLNTFSPKFTMGALKPFLTGFVAQGIQALKTPEMRDCIRNASAKDGLFAQMRSDEMQLSAQMERALVRDKFEDLNLGAENEEVVEEIGAISDAASETDED